MKIEDGNANKRTRINKRFSISIILALVIFMISGSAATMSYATLQTLPTCVDPTGQNLTCIMFISTLPPPKNTLQCQETSGQIFKCTYIVDKLSNGNRIVAITVYVPANFVFSSPTEIKVVEHETTKITIERSGGGQHCPDSQFFNRTTDKCQYKPTPIKPPIPCKDNFSCPIKPPVPCKNNFLCPYVNMTTSSAPSQPSNTSIPANTSIPSSGKPGTGSTCVNNCTSGTPPPVDCTKNPNDPSCTQTLTPPPTSPTTKTCPDGSVIDASATCPTPSTIPNTPPPPSPSTPPPPPPSNNPSPPSDNGNPSGGSGSSNGGGSSPPQPSTLS